MADPFAWMRGQLEAAQAAQSPGWVVNLPPAGRSVVEAIRKHGGPMTVAEYQVATGLSKSAAADRMKRAVRDGHIERVGYRRGGSNRTYLYAIRSEE